MKMKAKVRKIGKSFGGLTEAPESRMTAERAGFLKKAEIAEELMQRYRNALRKLGG